MRTFVRAAALFSLVVTPALAQDSAAPPPAAAPVPSAEPPAAEPPAAAPPAALTPEQEGDALMTKRTLKGYEAAVEKYDAALKAKPKDVKLKLKLVTAINSVMRKKTNGNLITLKGPADSAANKRIWSKLGTRSERLAKDVVKAMPKDVDANLQYAEAYMYRSASFGIIKAIMQGAADQYKSNANTLIKLNKKADGGVGYVYLGGFYMVAPWPISDDEESAKNYDLALKVDSKSIRNRYYRGLRAVKDEDWSLAKKHLTYAVNKPCSLRSEKDFCGHMKKKAKE